MFLGNFLFGYFEIDDISCIIDGRVFNLGYWIKIFFYVVDLNMSKSMIFIYVL